MAKKDHQPQSHTEVHVETHAQAHASASAPADDRVEELTQDLQRVQAEFINYKRRAEEEKRAGLDYAKVKIIREFLTVRDTFDQEATHRPADTDPKWAASIDAIRAQFDAVLKNLGVERFDSLGHAFDPYLHNAVVMEDGDGQHEVVVEELQPGYRLGELVLRHAMVKVGHRDDPPVTPTAPAGQ